MMQVPEVFSCPPLKGEGRTAKRSGEGSFFGASMTPTRFASQTGLPLSGRGEELS